MPIPFLSSCAERHLLRDTVRERLRSAILDGTLEPGEQLHDEEMMRWLGVSRTPLREALGDLARAGLVEMVANRYTRVTEPQENEAIDAIQTLGVLFGGAVRLAVPRLPDDVRKQVLESITICQTDVKREDGPALSDHTVALLATYVEHCGNQLLQAVCRDVTDGLAYRLRLPNIIQVLSSSRLSKSFDDLRVATIVCDPIAAGVAAEALRKLPRQRAD